MCTAKVKKIGSRRAPAVFSRRCGTVDILKVRRDGGTILTLARCGSDELEIGALWNMLLILFFRKDCARELNEGERIHIASDLLVI